MSQDRDHSADAEEARREAPGEQPPADQGGQSAPDGEGHPSPSGPDAGGTAPVDEQNNDGQAVGSEQDIEQDSGQDTGQADQDAEPSAEERLQAEVLDLQDQVARGKADAYNAEQRFNAFVKRSREQEAAAKEAGRSDVVEALIPVLDDIALARQHGELTGPFLAIADKLEATLSSRYGLERFGEVGEEFDPTLHEALMHQTAEGAESTTIAMVAQPGYRRGEAIVRPARVGVVGPE
ncbi:nucleotide exchange factor GrpE [Serinibacter salmoneus]|uniref:Protein GrpE n=1 Tax=Serinibacter salmoneus TaxID=556530 RepID=A0A2A9D3C7_9MICO|nr:nucleotide exchange factor GrpE [Serinibacter salmoneus]PFG20846.1 molecular chaperone GrpE [Serinibacter salmoneus]